MSVWLCKARLPRSFRLFWMQTIFSTRVPSPSWQSCAPLFIRDGSITITGIKYKIRSADLSELIDRGSINDFANSENENGIDFELPIGNYLSEWRQYRLDLTFVTKNKGDVHYYTAIMKCQQEELMPIPFIGWIAGIFLIIGGALFLASSFSELFKICRLQNFQL